MKRRVAIQGVRGSFHEQALGQLMPAHEIELVECEAFGDVFEAVANGRAEQGLTAIENNIHGSINAVYRLLNRYHLWVSGEVTLHVKQYLIGYQTQPLEHLNKETTTVMSQAPALAQCELWLDAHLPLAKRQETHDTAESVRHVVEAKDDTLLAIASKQAAELYGGQIVAGPINDEPDNYTRFVLLQKGQTEPVNANRTLIILKTDHTPGALHRALGVFAEAGINLSKLDSHPIIGDERHYSFYIDFDAGLSQAKTQQVLAQLRQNNCSFKVLGSYKV